jgi:hypothetical protein
MNFLSHLPVKIKARQAKPQHRLHSPDNEEEAYRKDLDRNESALLV